MAVRSPTMPTFMARHMHVTLHRHAHCPKYYGEWHVHCHVTSSNPITRPVLTCVPHPTAANACVH